MRSRLLPHVGLLLLALWSAPLSAEELPATGDDLHAARLAEAARDQIVLITYLDRDGEAGGQGTGFIVGEDGLIATNLHVIGEARPIHVTFVDGTTAKVVSIFASDRKLDLAVLRVDRRGLKPLVIGEPEGLKAGDPVVAVGHPLGLTHSVVAGVLSARREVEGRTMLQLAMPVEAGNSGGPVFGRDGFVYGIVTAKSLVTANLGFAIPGESLTLLLARPNPIPMSRWLTVGALDPAVWQPRLSGAWRQQPGHLSGSSDRADLTGRSLCLSGNRPPDTTFEVACEVRLADESGAAGLAFAVDEHNHHYAFYPSNGRLRLTRFDGATVFTWHILAEVDSVAYRPGNWNHLRVHVDPERIECFVNGESVIVQEGERVAAGAAGLVRFRDVSAEFRRFVTGKDVPAGGISPMLEAQVSAFVEKAGLEELHAYQPPEALTGDADAVALILEQRAHDAEERAAALRVLAGRVRCDRIQKQIETLAAKPAEELDVVRIGLLVASLDHADIDVEAHVQKLAGWAAELKSQVGDTASAQARYEQLNRYFFKELGFHGSRTNYYDRANSRLDQVINDREGLPISLAILYQYLGQAVGLKVDGLSLPGHFVVGVHLAEGEQRLVDVFEDGHELTREDADRIVQEFTGYALTDADLAPADGRQILARVLRNLVSAAESDRDDAGILRYLDALTILDPGNLQDQWLRTAWLARNGYREEATRALEKLVEKYPDDLPRIMMLRSLLGNE